MAEYGWLALGTAGKLVWSLYILSYKLTMLCAYRSRLDLNQNSMTALLKHLPENTFPRDKLCSEYNASILFKTGKKWGKVFFLKKRFDKASPHSHLKSRVFVHQTVGIILKGIYSLALAPPVVKLLFYFLIYHIIFWMKTAEFALFWILYLQSLNSCQKCFTWSLKTWK